MAATNLPADLPENWQQGQIVSPNGTDVGLTEQHGYNYMAKQINDTQEAVNTHTADTTNPHDVTAEQVGAAPVADHNIKTYTSLEQIGLSDTDMSATDFKANIGKINLATGGSAVEVELHTSISRYTNLMNSLKSKLAADTGSSIISDNIMFRISRYTENTNMNVVIDVLLERVAEEGNMYSAMYNEDSNGVSRLTAFYLSRYKSGFLPLDGSVAMTGNLRVQNGNYPQVNVKNTNTGRRARIEPTNSGAVIFGNDDDTNNNLVHLYLNKESISVNGVIRIAIGKSGNVGYYSLFGEHNTQLLATTIQSLIQGGSISMIKSVQRGIITIAASATEGTATLAQAVNMSKAVVLFGGSIYGAGNGSSYSGYWDARLVLSANNKVNASRAYSASYTAIVPYQVLEFA